MSSAEGEEMATSIFWRETCYLAKNWTLLYCNLVQYKANLKTTKLLFDIVLEMSMTVEGNPVRVLWDHFAIQTKALSESFGEVFLKSLLNSTKILMSTQLEKAKAKFSFGYLMVFCVWLLGVA